MTRAAAGSLILFVAACQPEGSILDTEESPGEQRQYLAPGDVVSFRDLELTVPEPGFGVGITAETDDGGYLHFEVNQAEDGETLVRTEALQPLEEPDLGEPLDDYGVVQSELITNPCQDGAYVRHHKWAGTMSWWFQASSTPTSLNATTVETLLKRAANNIVTGRNDCGRADAISATHLYKGRTTRGNGINVGSTISCGPSDGYSVVNFGPQTSYKAYTCWWWNASSLLIEADIEFNRSTLWSLSSTIPAGCTTALDFESVATHEFGHAFGLKHPGADHPSLTMQPGKACDLSKRTLGLGDLRGLESYY